MTAINTIRAYLILMLLLRVSIHTTFTLWRTINFGDYHNVNKIQSETSFSWTPLASPLIKLSNPAHGWTPLAGVSRVRALASGSRCQLLQDLRVSRQIVATEWSSLVQIVSCNWMICGEFCVNGELDLAPPPIWWLVNAHSKDFR